MLDVGHRLGLPRRRARAPGRPRVVDRAPRAPLAPRRAQPAPPPACENVTLVVGDGTRGLPRERARSTPSTSPPRGSVEALAELEAQLAPGGRLVAPVTEPPAAAVAHPAHATRASSASCWRRCASSRWSATTELRARHRRRAAAPSAAARPRWPPPRARPGARRTRARGRRAASRQRSAHSARRSSGEMRSAAIEPAQRGPRTQATPPAGAGQA